MVPTDPAYPQHWGHNNTAQLPGLDWGGTYDHTFNTPGTYTYYCTVHGFDSGDGTAFGMVGEIEVVAVPEPGFGIGLGMIAILLGRRRAGRSAR